ncbi:MAG TPA: LysR substrate-binding domain-containing protein [Polyangiaceae bacterium]|jgi:LysR family hydrogen peroxide-inducible transcriptional activator|nr:LysR substrate-binding domain-containing protein [Polyangiaceae bacterium]
MDRPSVRQLEYLVAVAKALNFREAAKQCHISQPALSAQILRLEEILGVKLFERDRRHVLLTPVGKEVADRAVRLLAELDDLASAATAHAEPHTGVLRLGVIPTVAPYVMPRALPKLVREFPKLEILLREEQTARCVELIESGKLDLLLLALEAELGDLETEAVFPDPFLFACERKHPLAKKLHIAEGDLRGERILLLEDGHCLKDQAWEICKARGVREPMDFRATSLGTLAQMVSAGNGVTLLPSLSLKTEGKLAGLAVRPFDEPVPFRTIGLAWRRTSPRKALFRAIAQSLRTLAT